MRRVLKSLVLFAVAILITLPAAAADNGFYLGGSVGQAAVATGELGDDEFIVDDDSTGYKVFAGFRMITFLGIEGSYVDLGTTEEADTEASLKGVQLQGMVYLPLGIADIFAKGGMISWETEFNRTVAGPADALTRDGTDPVYGAGVQFRIQSFCVRGEVEYFDIESTDEVVMYSVGASYTF